MFGSKKKELYSIEDSEKKYTGPFKMGDDNAVDETPKPEPEPEPIYVPISNHPIRFPKDGSSSKPWRRIVKKTLLWGFISFLLLGFGGFIALLGYYFHLDKQLPKITSLDDYRPPIITNVYSADNQKMAEFYRERRIVIPLEQMPKLLIYAFVAAEDDSFFEHEGVDIESVIRAFVKNVKAGTIVQGASTITMQVTRSFLLTPEQSYKRKLKEAILAYRIDKRFTKEEILFLYLNQIYLGHGAYGVEAASQRYFGKNAKDLNLAECSVLAGLPKAPSKYSPYNHPELVKSRQKYVLAQMVEEGYITQSQADDALNHEIPYKDRKNYYSEVTPWYTEHVRRVVQKKYGKDILYTQGLQIYTAADISMQKAAQSAIEAGLRELDKRQGYRGPIKKIKPEEFEAFLAETRENIPEEGLQEGRIVTGVVKSIDDRQRVAMVGVGASTGVLGVKEMAWARKPNAKVSYRYAKKIERPGQVLAVGDVIDVRILKMDGASKSLKLALEQTPAAQSALLCVESETGLVKAMIGGYDFSTTKFNRAVQSRRQPGSAFKTFIYAAAIDKGFTPASMINDNADVFGGSEGRKLWKPRNYDRKFYGPILLRSALAKSRNLATINILEHIGIDYVIEYAKKLGITTDFGRNLSIALGSTGVSLLEMVQAYSVFANYGELVEPVFITKIVDRDGNILEEAIPHHERVIEESTAYIVTSLLESVIKNGTGRKALRLKRPTAGKTGTTNEYQDAWFVGYTPRYISGVWVGFDQERPLGRGEAGSSAALPIWVDFMEAILADEPVRHFQVPEGVVFSKIDADTGLLPIAATEHTVLECFKEGTVPTEYTQKPDTIVEPEGLFKSDL